MWCHKCTDVRFESTSEIFPSENLHFPFVCLPVFCLKMKQSWSIKYCCNVLSELIGVYFFYWKITIKKHTSAHNGSIAFRLWNALIGIMYCSWKKKNLFSVWDCNVFLLYNTPRNKCASFQLLKNNGIQSTRLTFLVYCRYIKCLRIGYFSDDSAVYDNPRDDVAVATAAAAVLNPPRSECLVWSGFKFGYLTKNYHFKLVCRQCQILNHALVCVCVRSFKIPTPWNTFKKNITQN